MIESSVNQVALQQKQANISESSVNLHNQEAKNLERTAEEASSNPVTQTGVQNSDLQSAPVSSQPADVVTRLGETKEYPSLYQPTHQTTGKVIRPEIQAAAEANARAQEAQNQQLASQPEPVAKKATNPESWATDTNQLVGN